MGEGAWGGQWRHSLQAMFTALYSSLHPSLSSGEAVHPDLYQCGIKAFQSCQNSKHVVIHIYTCLFLELLLILSHFGCS